MAVAVTVTERVSLVAASFATQKQEEREQKKEYTARELLHRTLTGSGTTDGQKETVSAAVGKHDYVNRQRSSTLRSNTRCTHFCET